jgi:hypothetical protein
VAHLAEQDRTLPKYVQNEFEEYLKCGILSVPYPLRLLFASQPLVMGEALRIVYRTIDSFLKLNQAGQIGRMPASRAPPAISLFNRGQAGSS